MRELPEGEGWQYEPKWDGFRGVLENAGGELALWLAERPAAAPLLPGAASARRPAAAGSALDGEIVIARDGALDFDAMQMRLHPAESRIKRLSAEIPAEFVVFDVLVWDGEAVWKLPLEERRARVESLAGLPHLAGDARHRRGARLARPLRGARARRRDRASGSGCRTCPARATGW